MAIQSILKMGDPRLLRVARPVLAWNTPELRALVADMYDTMRAASGAGLAAPQIGVDLQVVIFGSNEANPRYPGREAIPPTVLINPVDLEHVLGQVDTSGSNLHGGRPFRFKWLINASTLAHRCRSGWLLQLEAPGLVP